MTGNPAPGVRWLKNEQEFEPDGTRVKSFVQDDGIFGLVFETTVADDKGVYTAVAFNDEGMARSNANVAIKTRLKEGVERLVNLREKIQNIDLGSLIEITQCENLVVYDRIPNIRPGIEMAE